MIGDGVARDYWEAKILRWEYLRYSKWLIFYPLSWPLRKRMNFAARAIRQRLSPGATVLELGCGSGILAREILGQVGRYWGVDIAQNAIASARHQNRDPRVQFIAGDAVNLQLPKADLTVMLGFTDWISKVELHQIVDSLMSPNLLISYTSERAYSKWNPYRYYRRLADRQDRHYSARPCNDRDLTDFLCAKGYKIDFIFKSSSINPGNLIWASR